MEGKHRELAATATREAVCELDHLNHGNCDVLSCLTCIVDAVAVQVILFECCGLFCQWLVCLVCLQCFDAVGWVAGRASGL